MKIELEMLTSMAGPRMSVVRGDPYTTDIDEAARMVRAGSAKPANEESAKAVEEKIAELEEEEAFAAAEPEPELKQAAKK
jgi:hypothetical protein